MELPSKLWLGGGALALTLFVWLWADNARLESRLIQERAASLACLAANEAFAEGIKRQNDFVAALKKEGAARTEKARRNAEAAKKTVSTLRKKEAALRKTEPTGEPCAVAERLLDAYLRDNP